MQLPIEVNMHHRMYSHAWVASGIQYLPLNLCLRICLSFIGKLINENVAKKFTDDKMNVI